MFYTLFCFFFRITLFAATSTTVAALSGGQQTAFYPNDAAQRGTEIVNTFNSLAHASGVQVPEVALQTNLAPTAAYTTYRYIVNGIIPYIQSLTQTTYNTLLIVTYLSTQTSVPQYIVLPTEQVIALLYFPTLNTLPTSSAAFTSGLIPGTLSYFVVDPKQRAADIASAITKLLAPPFKTSPLNQVWVQTTLTGPFNPPVSNGLLQNVTGVSVNNSLIQIQFLPPNQKTTLTVILTPEQVQQITYILNFSSP